MRIWLLEDGERTGPHEVYTVRDMISNGEVDAETLAWYEGVDGWVTLADVPAYGSSFSQSKNIDGEDDETQEGGSSLNKDEFEEKLERHIHELRNSSPKRSQPNSEQFQNEPLHPVRRFFARMLDIWIYSIAIIFIKLQMGMNPFDQSDVFRELLFHLPYILVDGLALTYLGTTPGKWLLEIKLRRSDGYMLNLDTSVIRAARVWVLGFAMSTPFILVTLPLSWFVASKYGKFLWDIPQNNITECSPLNPIKIALYVVVVIGTSAVIQSTIPAEYLDYLKQQSGFKF